MAMLNSTCTYALRAALDVAANGEPGVFVSIRQIAERLDVPFAFLTKVLQGLTQSGILRSQRGATGGIALARPAADITLLDVLAAVGGEALFHECVLGLPTCSSTTPCPLHESWALQRADLERLFSQTSLADLSHSAHSHEGADPAEAGRSDPRTAFVDAARPTASGEPTASPSTRRRQPRSKS